MFDSFFNKLFSFAHNEEPVSNVGASYDEMVGSISLFAGYRIPRGFVRCEGQILSIKGHEALFSIIGTMYGGNGHDNFALPDLRPKDARGETIVVDPWHNRPSYIICVFGEYPNFD